VSRFCVSNIPDLLKVLLALGLASLLVSGCALPLVDPPESHALSLGQARETRLGGAVGPMLRSHPGKSGIHTLLDSRDAFAARVSLARAAERTLDIQYYIWRNDITGTLLLEALHAAADRGVRVRLLLDDNGISGLDNALAALALHPLIEVRLFNPFVIRTPKWLGFITDFSRANRRMHNKSFTADNQASIIGGRNIGDEYFGATDGVLFADLDVLAVGPVVQDVSADFDRYWASSSAFPVESIVPPVDEEALDRLSARASLIERDESASEYVRAIVKSGFVRSLLEGQLDLEWADTRMVSDDPAKGLGMAEPEGLLSHQLFEVLGSPASRVALVSPYFVPTKAGVEAFAALAEQGVEVSILTNSLDATDVTAVHAGYAKRRKALLEAGIRLYEMRRFTAEHRRSPGAGPFGSSGSSLHAKTFAVDGERVFVGSFNFDPRSFNLNTELGFVIESSELAENIHRAFETTIPLNAYEVRLAEDGDLYWLEQVGDEQIRHKSEPDAGLIRSVWVFFLSLLPIEGLL